jgi:hypothetical protein
MLHARALCVVRLGGAAPNPPGYLENRDDVYAAQFLSEEACAAMHLSYDCDTVQAGTPMTVNGDEPLPSRRGLFCFLESINRRRFPFDATSFCGCQPK